MAWLDCGLQVNAVIGHSFGQLTALCVSGILSLSDALKLIGGRANIMLDHWGEERGSMMFLEADLPAVVGLIKSLEAQGTGQSAEIACYNGPSSHVVVGSAKSINALESLITAGPLQKQVRTKILKVTHGFHSRFTDPLLPHLSHLAKEITWQHPRIQVETCTKNQSTTKPDFSLLVQNTRKPVFFQQAVERLAKEFPRSTSIGAGRGFSVIQLVKKAVPCPEEHVILSPQLTTINAQSSLVDTTVELWKSGHAVQWWQFHRMQKSQYENLILPPYQFEKTRHWLPFTGRGSEGQTVEIPAQTAPEKHELLSFLQHEDDKKQTAIFQISPHSDRFKNMLGAHVMAGEAPAPASLYFELVSRAALQLHTYPEAEMYVPVLEDLSMYSPIGVNTNVDITLHMKRTKDLQSSWSFIIKIQGHPTADGHISQVAVKSTGNVSLRKRDDPQAAQNFKRFETLTGLRRYEELFHHPDAEKMQGKHIYRAFDNIVHYAEHF